MEKKLKNRELKDTVFKCLIRTLKDNKLYYTFRCSIGHSRTRRFSSRNDKKCFHDVFSSLDNTEKRYGNANFFQYDNPFYYTLSINDIFNVLDTMFSDDTDKSAQYIIGKDDEKIQKTVLIYVNTILHHCLEKAINNLDKTEKIGEKTFNMICQNIFGDAFVDKMPKLEDQLVKKIKPIENINEERARVTEELMRWLRSVNAS